MGVERSDRKHSSSSRSEYRTIENDFELSGQSVLMNLGEELEIEIPSPYTPDGKEWVENRTREIVEQFRESGPDIHKRAQRLAQIEWIKKEK